MEHEPTDEIQFWRNKAHEYDLTFQEQKKVTERYINLYVGMTQSYEDLKRKYDALVNICHDFNDHLKEEMQ